jgi:DNA-directed RNA polymerase subunit RPC12/RpoP
MKKITPLTETEKLHRDAMMEQGRYAFTPVMTEGGFSLGVAIENMSGYCPTNYHSVPTYDEAAEWANLINDCRISREEAMRIVGSSMARKNRFEEDHYICDDCGRDFGSDGEARDDHYMSAACPSHGR